MRPLKITIEGIKSFDEEQTVDFTELGKNRIFVISGVTGAGKTTVLDCIILALYGSRKGDKLKNLDEYISLRREDGSVTLDFEAEDGNGNSGKYRVTRTLYRGKRGNKASLIDLNTGAVIAEGGDKVSQTIEEVIGLKADSFTKVVVLEQGKYNEFLKATKANRNELVGSLFKLEKYAELHAKAAQKQRAVEADIAVIDEYLNRHKELTAASIAEKKKRLKSAEKAEKEAGEKLEKLSKLRDAFNRASIAYSSYEEALNASKSAKENLDKSISALAEFEKKQDSEKSGDVLLKEYSDKLAEARQRLSFVESQRENVTRCQKAVKDLNELRENYRNKKNSRNDILGKIDTAEKQIKTENTKIEEICRSLTEYGVSANSDCTSTEVQRLLGEFRLSDAASAIRSQLKEGDSCPVCGGKVGQCHASTTDNDFAAGEKILLLLAEKVKAREQADKDRTALVGEDEKLVVALNGLENEGKALKAVCDGLREQIGDISDPSAFERTLATLRAEITRLETEYAALKKSIDEREVVHKRLIAQKATALGAFETCAENERKLKCEKPDETKMTHCKNEIAETESARDTAVAERSALVTVIENDENELTVKREKESRKKELVARSDRLRLLAKMFKGDAFLEFISQEYIEDFCMDASEQLARMSGGCYTLGYDASDAEFFVMDFKAGNMKRSVRTLSGGETFLASLSLAIAVSRAIAEKNTSGVKFDFLFLDEGFGTLHEDAIAVVERALRNLSKDTLVGIVTHRSELTELISDKLIVEKATDSAGSRVKIVS